MGGDLIREPDCRAHVGDDLIGEPDRRSADRGEPAGRPHALIRHAPVGPTPTRPSTNYNEARTTVLAKAALKQLGYKGTLARAAVDKASAHVGANAPLELLIRAALQRCGA